MLTRLIGVQGAPAYLRSDSGREFVSQAIPTRLTAVIDPGKPWQNGTNDSFDGKFRDECLSPVPQPLAEPLLGNKTFEIRRRVRESSPILPTIGAS